MKAPKFKYVRADSVRHVLELLDEHGDDATILAGGQSLIPTLNMRLAQPALLVDINRLDDLKGIALDRGTVRIGALARHVEVMMSPVIAEHLPLIAEAMPHVAHMAVRNRGTFGGSIALADPAAEMPACALALRATFVVESVRGRREIEADDFFHGLYETGREPDELLVETRIPIDPAGGVSVFAELARRHGDFAMAGIAGHARVEAGVVTDTRLVYFGSEDRPTLATAAMTVVDGESWSDEMADAAAAALADDLDPVGNLHGSAGLKMHLQRVLTRRALKTAFDRARAA